MRERELKPRAHPRAYPWRMSLPMRERELKPALEQRWHKNRKVAPHAGARIETCQSKSGALPSMSLPMRERELKPQMQTVSLHGSWSLPMRERIREAGLPCPRADRYCRAAAGVAVSHQHRTEK